MYRRIALETVACYRLFHLPASASDRQKATATMTMTTTADWGRCLLLSKRECLLLH